jgi:hypothetical protein
MVSNNFDVLQKRIIDAFGHIELLEQAIVLLFFIVEMIYDGFIEDFLFNVHQRFDILETDIILQSSSQEEEILNDA